ncbi:MAG: GGDEF domain-containing protein [Bryobacteraceae bacterium]
MISLHKTATELDRFENLFTAASECYKLALRSVSHYAIEVDPHETAALRDHIDQLGQRLSVATIHPDEFRAIQSSFRGELREYRDQVQQRLARMKTELEASATALAALAGTISCSGADHEKYVRRELERLNSAAQSSGSMEELRSRIRKTISEIGSSLDNMRRANEMTVAQLRDEIRVLHDQLQAERRALFTDPCSGAWNRQKIVERLEEMLRQPEPFCLVLIGIRNLKRIEQRYSRTVLEGTLKALLQRFRGMTGDAAIGRWSDDQFAALLDIEPGGAMALSREAARKLSGAYSVQENGLAQEVLIEVTAGVLVRGRADDSNAFRKKLGQLASALSGV